MGYFLPDVDKPQVNELLDVEELKQGYDKCVGSKVMIPRDGFNYVTAKVVKRSRDREGNLIGRSNDNPSLDSAVYDLEFPNGEVDKYTANIIAESILLTD